MGLSRNDVVDVLVQIARKIESEKDYITELDAILGDGDHWVNMNKGYQALIAKEDELRASSLADVFKTTGMTLMAAIGGSSGALYGSAYLQMFKASDGIDEIDLEQGLRLLEVSLEAIMNRGKAKPGDKTMIDPLSEALLAFGKSLEADQNREDCLKALLDGARKGMEDTKDMRAMKGRATYQQNKGQGHIDAGAVTMYYTIEAFARKALQ